METHQIHEPADEIQEITKQIDYITENIMRQRENLSWLKEKRCRLIYERAGIRDGDEVYWRDDVFIFSAEHSTINDSSDGKWASVHGFRKKGAFRPVIVCYIPIKGLDALLKPDILR